MRRRQSDRIRKQIRMISEAIDDDPQMLGHKMSPGQHPIDQLIQFTQQNMIKWSWNDNKFIRAMRDTYHNAGKPVPSSKEELIKDLQKESGQDSKLLDKLVSALGGMSRRHFMGLSAGGAAGVATGAIDLSAPEKGQVDKTLRPGQHYKVTYRNFQNKTRIWQDLVFDSASSGMYWFIDQAKTLRSRTQQTHGRARPSMAMPPEAAAMQAKHLQMNLREKQEILAGTRPYREAQAGHKTWGRTYPAKPAKFVRANWPKTIAKLKRQIAWGAAELKRLQGSNPRTRRHHYMITLQVENIIDVMPLGGK